MNDKRAFLTDCARYIRGDISEVKLVGRAHDVRLFADVLNESRKFYVSLNKANNLSTVLPLLERKKAAARRLYDAAGFSWPF